MPNPIARAIKQTSAHSPRSLHPLIHFSFFFIRFAPIKTRLSPSPAPSQKIFPILHHEPTPRVPHPCRVLCDRVGFAESRVPHFSRLFARSGNFPFRENWKVPQLPTIAESQKCPQGHSSRGPSHLRK